MFYKNKYLHISKFQEILNSGTIKVEIFLCVILGRTDFRIANSVNRINGKIKILSIYILNSE